jgi:hypothetical protein
LASWVLQLFSGATVIEILRQGQAARFAALQQCRQQISSPMPKTAIPSPGSEANMLSRTPQLNGPLGEASMPTLIGADGTIFAINDATRCAIGNKRGVWAMAGLFIRRNTGALRASLQCAQGALQISLSVAHS